MTEQRVRHDRRLRDFDGHLATFVLVISGLALLNWIVSPSSWWVALPAIGWSIGLAAHAAFVFGDSRVRSSSQERNSRDITVPDGRGAR